MCYEEVLTDEKNENSCSLALYQCTPSVVKETTKDDLLVKLIGHYLETPFFDELRTKQALGYNVYAADSKTLKVPFICFLIHSPKQCAEYLMR